MVCLAQRSLAPRIHSDRVQPSRRLHGFSFPLSRADRRQGCLDYRKLIQREEAKYPSSSALFDIGLLNRVLNPGASYSKPTTYIAEGKEFSHRSTPRTNATLPFVFRKKWVR